jgi:phage terminase large subunit-like protein
MIERYRVARDQVPPLKRVVVAVDPAVKSPDPAKAARGELDESVAETGIVIAGLGLDDQGYVLADYSMQGMPLEWANQGIVAFDSWKADAIVGEVNNGGDLVESNFRTVRKNISYQAVRATRGKLLRAEPVSNLYQQGRIHHVGTFPDLEDQMANWIPGDRSPDRLDALVWAFFALMIQEEEDSGILLATATDEDVALFGNPEMDLLSAWSSAQEMEW